MRAVKTIDNKNKLMELQYIGLRPESIQANSQSKWARTIFKLFNKFEDISQNLKTIPGF